jgi:hypothetical protein
VTDREQLAAALGRLDPRHREVLDYSLRRRVPDEDLSELFSGSPGGVAPLRAAAIERLSQDLGIQRGAELGTMLRELLDPATWELVSSAAPSDEAPALPAAEESVVPSAQPPPPEPTGPIGAAPPSGPIGASPRSSRGHRPVGAGDAATEPEATPEVQASPAEQATAPEHRAPTDPDEPDARGTGVSPGRPPVPVLDMLAGGGAGGGGDRPQRRRGSRRLAMGLAVAIAVLAPAGVVAALSIDEDLGLANGGDRTEAPGPGSGTRPFEPEPEAVGEPFPSDPDSAFQYPVARVSGTTALYDEPDGKVKVRIPPRTQWRTPRVLGIVDQRDGWLAVLAPELRNGEVGWIPQESVDRLDAVTWSVRADLSKRTVVVRRGSEVLRRFRVGVGRKGHSTPTGRFAVTDKLRVSDEGSPYGCCVVALTGHQTRLPEGWPGGDRLAIHATSDESGLGRAVSLGCMRAQPAMARWLMERVPLGTPVFIRR